MILHLNKIIKIQRLKFGKIKHEKNRGDRDEASGWCRNKRKKIYINMEDFISIINEPKEDSIN